MSPKDNLLPNLFLHQLLLVVNDVFLDDFKTFYQIQRLKSHIFQRRSKFTHHLHILRNPDLHHHHRQKFPSLNLKVSPQSPTNSVYIASMKPILLTYLMRTKVLMIAVTLLDLRLLLMRVLNGGGLGLEPRSRTFRLKSFIRTSLRRSSILQSSV